MRRRRMPNRPGVAAAAGEGGRSLSITSTRTAGNRGTAQPSSWASQAAMEEVEPRAGDQALPLVCRPGLELHIGVAGLSRERHGNLRSDGGQAVPSRALAQGGRSIDAVWFGLDRLPAVGGLAARYGDRAEQGLRFTEASVRYLWLDRARRVGHAGRRQLAAASAADRVSAGRGLRRSLLTPLAGSHEFCPLAASRRGCEQCEDSSRTAVQG